jgi:protein-tyrosine phosphatase
MFREVQLSEYITGRVFLNSMPGRIEAMQDFLSEAEEKKISRIINLTGEEEIRDKSPDYQEFLQREEKTSALKVESFPVIDFSAPEDDQLFFQFAEKVARTVISGENVIVHCGAGKGRTGMFAICLLLVMGLERETAESLVFSGLLLTPVKGILKAGQVSRRKNLSSESRNNRRYPS